MRRASGVLAVSILASAVLAGCSPKNGESAETAPAQAAAGDQASAGATSSQPCTPLETRAANGSSQQPAFAGQTRACGVRSNVAYDVQVVARGIGKPWAVEPLPDGSFLVSEKAGRLRLVSAAGQIGEPIA
ncbi:MAG TPA: PQQ-dependent sugar dehydrogenase, partial [Longimicrobium sp.]|nr:PQQ-dependent sugar dehydrogenase [Longimicrobium sp.]